MKDKDEKKIDLQQENIDYLQKNKNTKDNFENLTAKSNNDEEEMTQDQSIEEKHIDDDTEKYSTEEKLQQEIEKLRDEKLRLLADMENLRKRSDRERVDSIKYGCFNLARDILSPDDNLTRALEVISEDEKNSEAIKNLIDGLKMVQKEFSTILEKHGIKKINSLNSKFDHNLHQAMVEIESDKDEVGIVIQEMQSGYTMHERLLRPSMVGVSKKSNKESSYKENKEN